MSSSDTSTPDVQKYLGMAEKGGLPDAAPGTTPPPTNTAAGVSAIEIQAWYKTQFDREVAVGQDLMNAITTLSAAAPNQTVKSTLDNTIKTLEGHEQDLRQSIAELETIAEQASVPFTEEAAPVTGISRERIFTLQDYILFIFVLAYGFFCIFLLVLVGKRTGWSKPALGKILGILAVVTVLGYIVIQRYA